MFFTAQSSSSDTFHVLQDAVGGKDGRTKILSVSLSQPPEGAEHCLLGTTMDNGTVKVWKCGSDLDRVYENNQDGLIFHRRHAEINPKV